MCQDPDEGGIADRPDDAADIFHTFFGIAGQQMLSRLIPFASSLIAAGLPLAGLSLLGHSELKAVDPVYALPVELTKKLGIYSGNGEDW